MCIKILRDGVVVDAVLFPCFVQYDPESGYYLQCQEEQAQGLSAHDGSTYYHLNGRDASGFDGYDTVTIEETTEAEAAAIMEAIDANQPIPQPEPQDPDPDGSVDLVRQNTVAKMAAACSAAITGGVDVVLGGVSYHFSLTLEDQLNLISLQGMIAAGSEQVPYHADGQECRFFTAAEFQAIASAATAWKIYQESYFNSLRAYVQSMTAIGDLVGVTYGMPIPEEYQTDVLKQLLAQAGGAG